jgi:hypothetical protein
MENKINQSAKRRLSMNKIEDMDNSASNLMESMDSIEVKYNKD